MCLHKQSEKPLLVRRPQAFPPKPVRTMSALVGNAYMAAGLASACLHTMAVLQANQANLFKDLSESKGVSDQEQPQLSSSSSYHQAKKRSLGFPERRWICGPSFSLKELG